MAFKPITTERLVLRAPELGDAEALWQRRNLPADIAHLQSWEVPFRRHKADQMVADLVTMTGPANDEWWALTVVDATNPDVILGDVAIHLTWSERSAEIGFTFGSQFWGNGYATEAVDATLHYLFTERGVTRVEASLHPDNHPSARVLEAVGLMFEGRTRSSFWVGDSCSDTVLYGATRSDWDDWQTRPRDPPEQVELVPVVADNRRSVAALATHKSQERFVSPMLGNLTEALVPPAMDGLTLVPWFRAIEADGDIVGFIMAADITEAHPTPYLWRFLVDRRHQRRGIGSAALDRFEQLWRERGATAIQVSWVEGPGSPSDLYKSRGYEPTGQVSDGEIHAVKSLDPAPQ